MSIEGAENCRLFLSYFCSVFKKQKQQTKPDYPNDPWFFYPGVLLSLESLGFCSISLDQANQNDNVWDSALLQSAHDKGLGERSIPEG